MEGPPSGQPSGPQPPSGPVPPFVQQLARMLQEEHIAWSDAGDEIVVADTRRFADEVCPLYFKHRNCGGAAAGPRAAFDLMRERAVLRCGNG